MKNEVNITASGALQEIAESQRNTAAMMRRSCPDEVYEVTDPALLQVLGAIGSSIEAWSKLIDTQATVIERLASSLGNDEQPSRPIGFHVDAG